jgi:hypothetical protein
VIACYAQHLTILKIARNYMKGTKFGLVIGFYVTSSNLDLKLEIIISISRIYLKNIVSLRIYSILFKTYEVRTPPVKVIDKGIFIPLYGNIIIL